MKGFSKKLKNIGALLALCLSLCLVFSLTACDRTSSFDKNWIFLFVALFFITIIVLAVFFKARFSNKLDKMVPGTTFDEVVALIGQPSKITEAEGITTATWEQIARHFNKITLCTITFKDGKVVSVIR